MFCKITLVGATSLLLTMAPVQAQTVKPDEKLNCEAPSNAGLEACTGLSDTLPITNFSPLISSNIGGTLAAGILSSGATGDTGTVSTTSTTSTGISF